ncbi:ABC1 kinase family protein [Engelhardtia mirabilis]|uniref:ABC1 atypical kinase-like domain-containing protein n=1 Tax=Engelhardtia mirabilis TaxID=2528011 RepID=A0A518BJR9_9BACT|nr:putative protein kinase UbiB [Planctomycetes bacterium Pla133]QDV01532.1 putative protein kinase UbiB [Planctomycetes bacterium Pla86]
MNPGESRTASEIPSVVQTSRLRRGAALAAAGLGGLTVGRRTSEATRRKSAEHLARRLGGLRGLPQKVGQILSMGAQDSMAEPFRALTDGAQAVPLADLAPVLEQAWGRPLAEVVADIDPQGRAASIGQVHRATLLDGRDVAIKIQYPGIAAAIDSDLSLIGLIAQPLAVGASGLDQGRLRATLREALLEELDYRCEAASQIAYREACAAQSVRVPAVVEELSGDRILVSVWEEGQTIEEARAWPAQDRSALARLLVEHFLQQLFDRGMVHADPHPGNVRFRRGAGGPELLLYDFGSVYRVDAPTRLALLRLIAETFGRPEVDPFPLMVAVGFDADLLRPLRAKLPAVCRVLFTPFGAPTKFDVSGWQRSELLAGILGDDRWNFRMSGPPEFMLLVRAFQGLLYYLAELGEGVCWSRLLDPLVARHALEMGALALAEPPDPRTTFNSIARQLCIRVIEAGSVRVKVSLPVTTVDSLDDWLDGEIRQRIAARGIDLADLVRRVRSRCYEPQSLIRLEDDAKQYEVWLE